jgi:hypothetical protein
VDLFLTENRRRGQFWLFVWLGCTYEDAPEDARQPTIFTAEEILSYLSEEYIWKFGLKTTQKYAVEGDRETRSTQKTAISGGSRQGEWIYAGP